MGGKDVPVAQCLRYQEPYTHLTGKIQMQWAPGTKTECTANGGTNIGQRCYLPDFDSKLLFSVESDGIWSHHVFRKNQLPSEHRVDTNDPSKQDGIMTNHSRQ